MARMDGRSDAVLALSLSLSLSLSRNPASWKPIHKKLSMPIIAIMPKKVNVISSFLDFLID